MLKLGSDSLKERNTVTKGKVNHLLNVTPGANITSKVCHCQKNSNASNSECSVEWQQHHREGRQQLGLSGKFFLMYERLQICRSGIYAKYCHHFKLFQTKTSLARALTII